MEILIVIIITGLTALFIALPFFMKSSDNDADLDGKLQVDPLLQKAMALEGRKESLFSAIRDIDLDYGLGKLTKEDYEELRQKYRIEAASVLRELDQITTPLSAEDLDTEIEAEIKRSRSGHTPENTLEDEIEKEIQGARKSAPSEFSAPSSKNCPECGSQIQTDDLFCSKCGAKIKG